MKRGIKSAKRGNVPLELQENSEWLFSFVHLIEI
jgi:hypothetical protein